MSRKIPRYTRKKLKKSREADARERAEDVQEPIRLPRKWVDHEREMRRMTEGVDFNG